MSPFLSNPTIRTWYSYDDADRLLDIKHTEGTQENDPVLSQFSYTYNVANQISSYTGPEGTLNYEYDFTGQLIEVSGARSEDYSFDVNGNRTMTGYETGDGNRLLSDGVYDYEYDNEGNLLTKTKISDGEVTEFTWDYRNRLTAIVVTDAQENVVKEAQYTYDVFDRRIGVVEDADGDGEGEATERWTVYDGDNPWADFDAEGSLITRYLYGPNIDELWARIGQEGVDWYLTDYLGSVRQVVASDATILDEIDYDSFGQILNETEPENGDQFKFTSRVYDKLFAQYDYRARYYGPDTGRFRSDYPLKFVAGDPNFYRYVGNSPTTATDPLGLWNFYKWVYTGDGNTPDHIYEAAMAEAGEYLLQHSPIRGIYGFIGAEPSRVVRGSEVHVEGLALAGFNMDDDLWCGALVVGGGEIGPVAVGGGWEWTTADNGWIVLVDQSKHIRDITGLPVGAFFDHEGFGIYGYYNFLNIGVAGGGVEFSYDNFSNLFSSDYWMGRLPLRRR